MSTRRGFNKRGFTLIELMIAMAISLIIIAAIFGVYETMNESNLSIKASSDMQQNVRTALDSITKMMVNAGLQGSWNNVLANNSTIVDGLVYRRGSFDNTPQDNSIVSSASSICFTYWDDDPAYVVGTGYNRERRVQIYLDKANDEILANFEEFNTTPNNRFMPAGSNVVLARDISNLHFQYYDASDNEITSLSSQNVGTVRKITVTATGQTSLAQFISNGLRSFSLSTDVTPVNLGIAGHIVDAYPPASPTGLYVSDPHICTELIVQWNANKEVDLAGYTIFYGESTGIYDHKVDVGTASSGGICTYTLPPSSDTMNVGTQYYITITANNTSGLISAMAPEVYTGVMTPGVGTNDTTPNENPPSAPTVTASAGPGDGVVTLTWNSNPPNDQVTSYRVYRMPIPNPSSPPAFSYPIPETYRADSATNPVKQVSGHWQFTDSGLQGCTIYEYAVCGLNCTQPATGPISNTPPYVPYSAAQYFTLYGGTYTDNSGAPHTISYPIANETTRPTNGTPPPPPTGLVGIPGSNVVDLSWTNPTGDPDFQGVVIQRSTAGYPASPSDGTRVLNDYSSAAGQSCTYKDNGLANNNCYYYSAFSYNKCNIYNTTPVESVNIQGASSPACSEPCSSALYGEPPAPPVDQYSMSYCADKVNLGWKCCVVAIS